MAPSSLENDLDEFNVRYWESCQEVMTQETGSGILVSRLSSPLPVSKSPESGKNSQYSEHEKPAGKSRGSVPHVVEEREERHAVAEMTSTSGNRDHDTLHGLKTGVEGPESQTYNNYTSPDACAGTKVEAPRSKLIPEFPQRQNLGNPFYRRGSAGKKSPVALSQQ